MGAKIPAKVQRALDATGLPWAITNGAKHCHIQLNGRVVGVLSRAVDESLGRGDNLCSAIRRAAREMRNAK